MNFLQISKSYLDSLKSYYPLSKSYDWKKQIILLCRHGEGDHLVGNDFNKRVGPSLTGFYSNRERRWTGGKGQAFRRISRQLADFNLTPDLILCSPQLRALETCAFSRLNKEQMLPNGEFLSSVPVRICRSVYEQTRCLVDQGSIVPPLKNYKNNWPNAKVISKDKKLWSAIQTSLSSEPRQPENDQRGSAVPRAEKILEYIRKRYSNKKCILVIAHDGILRDMVFAEHKKRCKEHREIFDLCEIRPLHSCQVGR